MSVGADKAPFHWWDVIRGGEPPPAAFLARHPFHPWLVVGVTCIGAFIGQLDASIVQLALPALKHVRGIGKRGSLGCHRLFAGVRLMPAGIRPDL